MKCKTCEKTYHCCGSCDSWGIEYMDDGYCSEKCFEHILEEAKQKHKLFCESLTPEQEKYFQEYCGMPEWLAYKL